MKTTMIEMCECGQQFKVNGINRRDYEKWKRFIPDSLEKTFPKMTLEHVDQLIDGLCETCFNTRWTD